MKKVILGAAALLFSGAIFAQVSQTNLSDVNGNNSMDANVVTNPLNGFATTGNNGHAIQNGTTNKLRVRQAGTSQSSYSEQSDGLGNGDNRARIWQTGDVSGISGVENASDVRQKGSGNQSTTDQEGDYNEAVTRQGMKDGGLSGGNRALISHGTAEQGEYNYAMIEQDGQDNRAKTVQSFDNNEARTVQEGDGNMSGIRQKSGPDGSLGNSALVEQYGDSNASKVYQDGHEQTAKSLQVGDGNKANQNQWGDDNVAKVNQGGAADADLADAEAELVNADPSFTNGAGGADSKGGKALQNQNGIGNDAYIGQWGQDDESNIAEQNQTGNSNDASIVQNSSGSPNGGANYARQDQAGDDESATSDFLGNNNNATIGQNGKNHTAYQRQYGDWNEAVTSQKGDGNIMSSYQRGHDNQIETGQRGSDNQILIVQKSGTDFTGHTFKAEQNLTLGAAGTGNTIDVLQLGPSGDLMNDGEGCDFQDPTDLSMPNGPGGFDIDAPCTPGTTGC